MKIGLPALAMLLLAGASTPSGFHVEPAGTVFPSGPEIPENLLRIELRFSTPLTAAELLERTRLLDDAGRALPGVFLDLAMPAPDGQGVSLLLHPGRVKSGLYAHDTLCAALHAGETVTLLVDAPMLAQPIRKVWRVVARDVQSPRPDHWAFTPPREATQSDLVVQLDAPLTAAARALIAVRGPHGERVPGSAVLEHGETRWRFSPATPWRTGHYAIITHPELEDPAGNRVCAAFEAQHLAHASCDKETELGFVPLPAL
jgi:hypothetical protein